MDKTKQMMGKERMKKEVLIVDEGEVMRKKEGNKRVCEFWEGIYWDSRKSGVSGSNWKKVEGQQGNSTDKGKREQRCSEGREVKIRHSYASDPRP